MWLVEAEGEDKTTNLAIDGGALARCQLSPPSPFELFAPAAKTIIPPGSVRVFLFIYESFSFSVYQTTKYITITPSTCCQCLACVCDRAGAAHSIGLKKQASLLPLSDTTHHNLQSQSIPARTLLPFLLSQHGLSGRFFPIPMIRQRLCRLRPRDFSICFVCRLFHNRWTRQRKQRCSERSNPKSTL